MSERALHVLDHLPVSTWTQEEAFAHLLDSFQRNVRQFPEIMERYVIATAETDDKNEQAAIMRRSLSETINQRFPYPSDLPSAVKDAGVGGAMHTRGPDTVQSRSERREG